MILLLYVLPPSQNSIMPSRAGGVGPVAQAMAGPIFETLQNFSSGHMLVQAGNIRVCRLQAKCRIMPD